MNKIKLLLFLVFSFSIISCSDDDGLEINAKNIAGTYEIVRFNLSSTVTYSPDNNGLNTNTVWEANLSNVQQRISLTFDEDENVTGSGSFDVEQMFTTLDETTTSISRFDMNSFTGKFFIGRDGELFIQTDITSTAPNRSLVFKIEGLNNSGFQLVKERNGAVTNDGVLVTASRREFYTLRKI